MNWLNRIDHHLRELEAKKEASALKEKIAEIEECACDLHDAYFGNDFSRESLLKSEEFLMMYAGLLRGLN